MLKEFDASQYVEKRTAVCQAVTRSTLETIDHSATTYMRHISAKCWDGALGLYLPGPVCRSIWLEWIVQLQGLMRVCVCVSV